MGIWTDDLIHPLDRKALGAIKAMPLLTTISQRIAQVFVDDFQHGLHMAQMIRLGPTQLPEYYRHLPPICELLGIAEPEFYLSMDPSPNAYTLGDKRPAVVMTSGLIDLLEEDELQAVLAHECGHIACHHALYHMIVHYVVSKGMQLGFIGESLVGPFLAALMHWSRQSEFSADRAAAVVMNGSKSVVETMIRLAGGPKHITNSVNVEAYLAQATAYDKYLGESTWNRMYNFYNTFTYSHPLSSVRAREVTNWCLSDEFNELQLRRDTFLNAPRCHVCREIVRAECRFCEACGAKRDI